MKIHTKHPVFYAVSEKHKIIKRKIGLKVIKKYGFKQEHVLQKNFRHENLC